jgi:adenine-specific DNA-methyltransferase
LNTIESFTNQVIHGECVNVMQSLPSESIDLAVTDPPYLVRYKPRDGRRCANDHTGDWLRPAFRELYRVLKPDTLCISFYGWPWIDVFMAAWRESGFRPVSHLVWLKRHSSSDGYTSSYHEVGYLLAKGRPQRPVIPPGDVLPWEYTGNALHPNQKPVIAITPLIEVYSKPGDIVIDPFAGSGTTGVAAEECNRRFILIETVSSLCQAASRRLLAHRPIHAGKTMSSMPPARATEPQAARGIRRKEEGE